MSDAARRFVLLARFAGLTVVLLSTTGCRTAGSAPATKQPTLTVVCFGDSTTAPRRSEGRALTVYTDALRTHLTARGLPGPIVNRGVRGSHTGRRTDNARHKVAHGRDRFETAVLAEEPDIVVIQFGLNDCWVDAPESTPRQSRIPLASYVANLQHFVRTSRRAGAAVVLMTPNAIGRRFEAWRHTILARYAAAVRSLAERERVRLIDAHADFGQASDPDELLLDGMHPNDKGHARIATRLANTIVDMHQTGGAKTRDRRRPTHYTIPTVDLADETHRQITVDREKGQYLGHPTTLLLEDGKTILTVYPKGHGRGAIVMKRSTDGGRTWSERLAVPDNWSTSLEVPTLHRVVDAAGKKRIIMFSGLYPCRMAVSEDDGRTFTPLRKVGDWGGIVVMGCVARLKTPGHYMAMFHDDGRFFTKDGMAKWRADRKAKKSRVMHLYKTFSRDGGLTWSFPESIWHGSNVHLCEPGVIRSPDGHTLAVLLRENRRVRNSHVIFTSDEGRTFTKPRELPAALTGDRHTAQYAPDGRLFVSFRDRTLVSPTFGDWVAWVGTFDDIMTGREGQYRVRLMDNHKGADCAYPGVEVLPDGTMVTTTYGHWTPREAPFIVTVRVTLPEIDARARTDGK